MNELERLQFLTRNYPYLQGYPIALVGITYIVLGAIRMLFGPLPGVIFEWVFLASIGLLCAVSFLVGRQYRGRFGEVKAPLGGLRISGLVGFGVFYVVLAQFVGPDFKNLKVALAPEVLNGGVLVVIGGLLPGFPWRHYVPVGLALITIAFLPAAHVVTVQQFQQGWNHLAVGIAFFLCGAMDRLILTRYLPPAIPVDERHA